MLEYQTLLSHISGKKMTKQNETINTLIKNKYDKNPYIFYRHMLLLEEREIIGNYLLK